MKLSKWSTRIWGFGFVAQYREPGRLAPPSEVGGWIETSGLGLLAYWFLNAPSGSVNEA